MMKYTVIAALCCISTTTFADTPKSTLTLTSSLTASGCTVPLADYEHTLAFDPIGVGLLNETPAYHATANSKSVTYQLTCDSNTKNVRTTVEYDHDGGDNMVANSAPLGQRSVGLGSGVGTKAVQAGDSADVGGLLNPGVHIVTEASGGTVNIPLYFTPFALHGTATAGNYHGIVNVIFSY